MKRSREQKENSVWAGRTEGSFTLLGGSSHCPVSFLALVMVGKFQAALNASYPAGPLAMFG